MPSDPHGAYSLKASYANVGVARIITIPKTSDSDSTFIYRESDFILTNLLPNLQSVYGINPVIFRKWDITNARNWVIVGNDYYLVKMHDKTPSASLVTSIGNKNEISLYCGTDSAPGPKTFIAGHSIPRVQGYISGRWASRESANRNVSGQNINGNEIPEVARRHQIPDFSPGDVSANSALVVTNDDSTVLEANASKEEVANAWQLWLNMGKTHGFDSAITEKTQLYFQNSRGQGEGFVRTKITTFAQLKAIFPRYFQFDKQLEAESFEALAGNSWINKYYVDGRWWDVERGYIGLWEIFARRGLSEAAIKRELLDGGYTEEQINAIRAVKGVTAAQLTGSDSGSGGSGGSGGSKGSGGAKTGDNQTWTGPEGYQSGLIQQITIQRSRNIFLTSDEILTAIGNDQRALSERNRTARPIMYQVYLDGSTDAVSGQPLINQYIFDLAPNEINYSNFGGEWVSIERIGGFPYIDWKNFKLLQISIQFTIAVNFGNTNTGDGLQISAMEQIKKLQRMAQTPFPVMFYRFDELLTNQFRYDDSGTPRGIQFIIQDLSISATQRNENMEITRATANLTLQEIPIERTNLIGMPRLVHKKIKPDEPVPFTDPEYGLTSANLTSPPDRTVTYRN